MAKPQRKGGKTSDVKTQTVNLARLFDWPHRVPKDEWWQRVATQVRELPSGTSSSWGIPFRLGEGKGPRVILLAADRPEVTVPLNGAATYLCFLHTWEQIPSAVRMESPAEGLVVGEYALTYNDGSQHVQPVRARFEVDMQESPGPPWLTVPFNMPTSVDPTRPTCEFPWGIAQYGICAGHMPRQPRILLYAMPNPHPRKTIRTLTMRGAQESPLLVAGLTLFTGTAHPFAHLPRRTYRVRTGRKPARIKKAEVDLGSVARIEHTQGPRDKAWLDSAYTGVMQTQEPERGGEDLIEIYGAPDATVSVTLEDSKKPMHFSLGEAFHRGRALTDRVARPGGSRTPEGTLEVLGQHRQWMQVRVIDGSNGTPTPVRIHFSGPRGEYLAPYGHHSQINTNWFEDYGADVVVGGRSYAYVPGIFTTDIPVGDVYVEICKGFEYEPIRRKITIAPGQKDLELSIHRWKDLRSEGWFTADTHVHFISPHTAWLEGQAEGVNVVNLLASQWGRLFTNVGDLTGRVGVAEDDTIVFVGTENRNHMLGHMSMLGTQGPPVYPMCDGGPSESWMGDPDFLTMTEWALENKRKGGVVIRPHFPYCGFTEDPAPILKGLVDALEIRGLRGEDFPLQEWYRYLNCGYRVAVAGGTDKMGAYTALGALRTYAKLDRNLPFTYENWAEAVRAGRTFATTGPVINLQVDGKDIGDTIAMPPDGGGVEVRAIAESFWPLGKLEVVFNGRVVASTHAEKGSKRLEVRDRFRVPRTGWIAARCSGYPSHPGGYAAAHTSPVYLACGDTRAFDGPAAEHMLALVEGGIEYLELIATAFDKASRARMVKVFDEARQELKRRLREEGR
jgi:hypothetical protein